MAEDLRRRLREAGRDELTALLGRHLPGLSPEEALLALANPHLDADGVERLAGLAPLLADYAVHRALALDRRTPETLARRLLPRLRWRDLVRAGQDVRLSPALRRMADQLVGERLAGLAAGERIAVARSAGPGLVARFRDETDPRVVAALLDNPRLTESAVLGLVQRERATPAALAAVARDRRWGVRYPVRLALVRHPATPAAVALGLLPHLDRRDQAGVARDLRVASSVRRRARLLSGQEGAEGSI